MKHPHARLYAARLTLATAALLGVLAVTAASTAQDAAANSPAAVQDAAPQLIDQAALQQLIQSASQTAVDQAVEAAEAKAQQALAEQDARFSGDVKTLQAQINGLKDQFDELKAVVDDLTGNPVKTTLTPSSLTNTTILADDAPQWIAGSRLSFTAQGMPEGAAIWTWAWSEKAGGDVLLRASDTIAFEDFTTTGLHRLFGEVRDADGKAISERFRGYMTVHPGAGPADPVDPMPGDREVKIVKPGGIGYSIINNSPNPPENVVIRDMTYIGEGTPKSNTGIRIVGKVKHVLIENVEISNMGAGIIVQAPNIDEEAGEKPEDRHVIESLTIRNCYVHDISKQIDIGDNAALSWTYRTQGVYAERVRRIVFEDCFFENVGFGGVDPRDVYSHIPYISTDDGITVEVVFKRCVFRNASSHAINVDEGGEVEINDVICVGSANQFGIKKLVNKPANLYSVAKYTGGLLKRDGTWPAPAKDFYDDTPGLKDAVTVIDTDPIDWAGLRNTWGDWYGQALADLKAGGK